MDRSSALLLLKIIQKDHLRLFGQVIRVVDGDDHPLYRQKCGQVGGIGGEEDEREEPPGCAHDAPRYGSEANRLYSTSYSKEVRSEEPPDSAHYPAKGRHLSHTNVCVKLIGIAKEIKGMLGK